MNEASAAIERCKRLWPKAWQLIKPKRYRGVERFGDYRWIYLWLAAIASYSRTKESAWENLPRRLQEEPNELALEDAVLSYQLAAGVPLFFVEPSLFEAVDRSDINFVVEWEDMPLPFPSFSFILPASNAAGLDYIQVSRVTATAAGIAGFANRDYKEQVRPVGLSISGVTAEGGAQLRANMVQPYDPQTFHRLQDHVEERRSIVRIAFNLIFAMAARPEYVERGHRIGHHRKSNSDVWTPNIIGRKYATKRDPNAETGTHASPRMHWRRGHFRQQAYGPQLTQHKVIWIEPMLVNAKVIEAAA